MVKINAGISLGKTNHGKVIIQFDCETSRTRFLSLQLEPTQFANLVLGTHQIVEAEVEYLDLVGKRKVTQLRSCEVPEVFSNGSRAMQEKYLEEVDHEEGWVYRYSLTSQNSITHSSNGARIANYSRSRWE